MSGRTLNSAILLLVVGNFLAIISDSIIKWQGGDVAIFQFVLIRVLCTVLMLLPFVALIDRRRLFAGTKIHLIRAHVGLAGVLCMIVALNNLPLATANAVFYAAPVLVMVFGVWFFGERLSWLSVFSVVSGFLGIMVILRPVEMSWASLSALGLAVALAVNALLVRKLPRGQSMVHTLMLTHIYVIPAALVLTLLEGAPLDPSLIPAAFGSSFFIMGYNITILLAYRNVAANQVTSAEYTGLLWALVVGWLWFSEVPDLWFYLGSAMIVVPILMQSLAEHRRCRIARRPCQTES
jgi:drug/metabolite transporter (DMT)-like permease